MAADDKPPVYPSWLNAVLAMLISLGTSLATFSYYTGKQEMAAEGREKRIKSLEDERERRQARELEKVYEFEKAKAAKYAEMEAQINALKSIPPPTP